MKIKITFNEKEKQALKSFIIKLNPECRDTDILDKPEKDLFGPLKYSYDGEGTFKIKITSTLSIMFIKFMTKISKSFMKFITDVEEYWEGYENAQLREIMENEEDTEPYWKSGVDE